jgi:hypothetical protein
MTRQQFERLLETYGADTARWPTGPRAAARALLARDPAARAALEAAQRLDALLDRYAAPAAPGSAERIVASLRELPPQQADLPATAGWGAVLAELWWELRSVPRVASIVVAVLCGLVAGFSSLGLTPVAPSKVDLSAFLFEPTPSDWLQL